MRVEPQVANLLFVSAEIVGDAGGYSRRDGMIAAKNQWQKTLIQGLFGSGGDIGAGLGNLLQVLGTLFADGHFFRLFDGEIADVFDLQAQLLEAGLETCSAQGGRSHVHAAAALAEVHGDADDANFLRHSSTRFVRSNECYRLTGAPVTFKSDALGR